jgi:molecular chaperone GrpE
MIKHDKEKKQTEKETEINRVTDKIKDTVESSSDINEIQKLKEEIVSLKDTLLRKAAEFENYKRRTEIEISNYIKYASEHLLKELLPVYDDVNRSIESIEKGETKDFETLKTGIKHIQDKFKRVLKKEGLKEIDVLGKEFDVNYCDALLQVPKDGVKPNTVIEVVEKGYFLKDKVIRHAKVLVSSETISDKKE